MAIVTTHAAPPGMLVSTHARCALVAGLCGVLEEIALHGLLPVVVLLRNVSNAPLGCARLGVAL